MEIINQLFANYGVGGTLLGVAIIALLIYSIMKGGGSSKGGSKGGSSSTPPTPPTPPAPPAQG